MFGLPHYWLTGLCTSAIARSSDYVEYRYGTYWTVSRLECTSVESTVRNNGCSQCFSAAGPCCLPLPRTWQTARSSALRDSGRLVVTMGSSRKISCYQAQQEVVRVTTRFQLLALLWVAHRTILMFPRTGILWRPHAHNNICAHALPCISHACDGSPIV